MKKRGAMELSIGTIVIIVLAMTMLILGIVLVKNILGGATDVAKLTDQQVKDQIKKLFPNEKRLIVYPDSKEIFGDVGKPTAFAIGIRNTIRGEEGNNKVFSYEVTIADKGNCGASTDLAKWILLGRTATDIRIPTGEDFYTSTVRLAIPEIAPLCTFRLQVTVKEGTNNYASDFMDVTIG